MEEIQTNVTGNEVEDMTPDYLAAIKELKENSVDRSKYEQLRAENKRLLDSVINGQTVDLPSAASKPSVDELRKKLFKDEPVNNLEYCESALALRDALIENGEKDPFLPYGSKIAPTNEDVECANRVAEVLKECVEYADGDPQLFTNELQRRTLDTGRPYRK